jgi:predicted DNA binding CopG/RHH family protein
MDVQKGGDEMKKVKEKRLQVRVNPDELTAINDKANSLGLMTSEFVRMIITRALKDDVQWGKSHAPKGQSLVTSLN